MVLTERDKKLLQTLQSYGIYTTKQICDEVFGNTAKTTVLRRLRQLERNRYIQRIEGLRSLATGWALTRKTANMLGDRASKIHFPRHSLDHEVELTALRLSLERFVMAACWIPEHEIRSNMAKKYGLRGVRDRVVPDGIASVRVNDMQESIAIELELWGKNSRRYRQSYNGYCSKRSLWGVWYVVGNPAIGRHLEKVWRRYYDKSGPQFFWCTLEELKLNSWGAQVRGVEWKKAVREILQDQRAFYRGLHDHKPAHEVSTLMEADKAKRAKLNTENEKEILAPAS